MGNSIKASHSDAVFGLTAVLEEAEYQVAARQAQCVGVFAGEDEEDYCECIYISRKDLLGSFVDWKRDQQIMLTTEMGAPHRA